MITQFIDTIRLDVEHRNGIVGGTGGDTCIQRIREGLAVMQVGQGIGHAQAFQLRRQFVGGIITLHHHLDTILAVEPRSGKHKIGFELTAVRSFDHQLQGIGRELAPRQALEYRFQVGITGVEHFK